jgi:hypothetical protein
MLCYGDVEKGTRVSQNREKSIYVVVITKCQGDVTGHFPRALTRVGADTISPLILSHPFCSLAESASRSPFTIPYHLLWSATYPERG